MKYFLLALFLSLAGASYAQTAMRDLLKTMPAALTPSLSENNRLDMVDFKDAGMAAIVTNAFEGKSELTQLTDNYASLRLSEALHLDMALLTAGGERVLCVVMTWGTDLRESTLSFYSDQWQPLPTARYVALPAYPFVATLDSVQQSLTLTRVNYFNQPANEEQEKPVNVQTTLNWNGNIFK